MGIMTFRPGQRLVIPGAQVMTPRMTSAATWWNNNGAISGCVAAYQPIGAADLLSSYINLANPGTNNAAPGAAPSLVAGGWSFNGSSQYLTTGIAPQATTSILIRYTGAALSSNRIIAGASESSTKRLYIDLSNGNNQRAYVRGNASATSSVGTAATTGIIGICGLQSYWNGATDTAAISDIWLNTALPMYIGALNSNGSAGYYASVTVVAVAIYNVVLTSVQVSTITTAMQAL